MNSIAKRISRWLRRTFEAAGSGSRWPITAMMTAPERNAVTSRQPIAARVAYLVGNAPIAESIRNCWTTNLIGDGPSARGWASHFVAGSRHRGATF